MTEFGRSVVQHYRAIENATQKTAAVHLEALVEALAEASSARTETIMKKTPLRRRLG